MPDMQPQLNGVARLTDSGLIRAQGEDAAKFLHSQLSQDFERLGPQQARLAAFCNAKGRMQASFIGFKRSQNDILLLCSSDILPATLKRLSMFILRSKVKLSHASDDFAVYGLIGQSWQQAIASSPQPMDQPWAKLDLADATLITLYPANGTARGLWLAPTDSAAPAGPTLAPEWWRYSEVRSGIVSVTAPIVEAFVPQMMNYESTGGVSFKKGCYPGQEVIARSQFRGSLKRRAYLAHAEVPLPVGAELFLPVHDSQPCGSVAQSAPAPEGGYDAIVSLQISAFAAGCVHLASPAGPPVALEAMPYPLLLDI